MIKAADNRMGVMTILLLFLATAGSIGANVLDYINVLRWDSATQSKALQLLEANGLLPARSSPQRSGYTCRGPPSNTVLWKILGYFHNRYVLQSRQFCGRCVAAMEMRANM